MSEYMTMTEIEAKYPNEWVFLANPTTRQGSLAPVGGSVVYHSPDHSEFLRRIFDFPEVTNGAILFTGPPVLDEVEESVPVGHPQ